MRNFSRGFAILAVFLLVGSARGLPEPKEFVLEYEETPGRLTRDRAAQPYRPATLQGKTSLQWVDWMDGSSLRAFWRQERRAQLPPPVDIWQGTPEEAVERLIERDRAGQPGERPGVVLPADRELPESGHLRFEFLLSSCSAPFREEAILRWEPAGAWVVIANNETPDADLGLPGRAELVDLAEARRIATICLLLARARFEAAAPPLKRSEEGARYIRMSSEHVTVTIRSDDRSVAEQVGHRLPEEAADQPWRAAWTPEFAVYLSRRVIWRLFTRLQERADAAAVPPAPSRAALRARHRERTVAQVQRVLEFSARAPELAMPMQLQQALAAVLECNLPELLPSVEPVAARLPPLFGWEKHVQALEAEITARKLELAKHRLPGLAEAIDQTPMGDEVNLEDLRTRFPGFVAEPLAQLQGKRLELKQTKPFYTELPYQIERDWQELRQVVAALQRRGALGDNVAGMRRWAEEEDAPWADWAYRRLKVLDRKAAAALAEARLLDPRPTDGRWEVDHFLKELEALAPERLPALLARLSPEARERYQTRASESESPASAAKTLAGRLASSIQRQTAGTGTTFLLEPLAAGEFARALRELEAPQLDPTERVEGMKNLAPHVPAQPDALRARFARLLPKLSRMDRLDVILLGDLREQRAYLLEHATSSPDDFAPDGGRGDDTETTQNLRVHRARWIVSLWDEPDAVTRASLVVALDLQLQLSRRREECYRWRLQELFRLALKDRSAAERDLVAARLQEISAIFVSRQVPADFEADWLAVFQALPGQAGESGSR